MDQFIERVDGGVSIALNQTGKRVTILTGKPVVLDQVLGSKLRVSVEPNGVTCETLTPEAETTFRWNFDMAGEQQFSRQDESANNLEAIVGELRVALNGKL